MSITKYDPSSVVGTADTGEGPSPAIWKRVNWLEMVNDPGQGTTFFDDFTEVPIHASTSGAAVSGPFGRYGSYIYQGGFISEKNTTGGVGGVAQFGSDGDNEGAAIGPACGQFNLVSTKGLFVYEARLATSTITDTKHGFFCGMLEGGAIAAAVPMATDGTLADKNFIGFHRLEGDGDMLDIVWKADGQTQQTLLADAITLVADTFVKIGIIFDPLAPAAQRLKFFKNGVPLTTYGTATQMAAATFPSDIALGPCFATMNATGTTPGNTYVDWIRAAQKRVA